MGAEEPAPPVTMTRFRVSPNGSILRCQDARRSGEAAGGRARYLAEFFKKVTYQSVRAKGGAEGDLDQRANSRGRSPVRNQVIRE